MPYPLPLDGGGLRWGWRQIKDKLTNFSRTLRQRGTDAGNRLWLHLKGKQIEGLKFRRQEPIGNFIVDFVAYERRLVIEIDGGQHAGEVEQTKDYQRDEWLKSQGFRILRFWNNEVLQNLEGVLETIRNNCLSHPPLAPPFKRGKED